MNEEQRNLFKAIGQLNANQLEAFFTDLCTPAELKAMSERFAVATLVKQKIPYRKISELTGASTATVTRVARAMGEGSGYEIILGAKSNATP